MVDYSKWDALEVSSDDDDYVDKPNSKEAYRRIKARLNVSTGPNRDPTIRVLP